MKKLLLSLFLSLFFLSLSSRVYADINAPIHAVNGDPSAGSTTKVQMKNEKVTFSIGQPIPSPSPYAFNNDGSPVFDPELPIKVTAQFSMYNTSDTSESIDVTFPKCDYYSGHNYGCDFNSYSNFAVSVNNQKIDNVAESTENIPSNQLGYCIDTPMTHGTFFKWHQSFPAKQITNVTVTYDYNILENLSFSTYFLDYVLSTGGSWFGNIENGEIIFSFPKPLIDEYFGLTSGETFNLSPKLTKSITGNTLSVKFSNIKPTVNENLHLFIFDFKEADIIYSLKQKAKNDNTASAYSALGGKYTGFIHGPYDKPGDTSQAFIYFDKAIDLANNFNELKEITNSIFFIKNGGDQQEATNLKNNPYECGDTGLEEFCSRGNWVYRVVKSDDAARNIFLKLANKRLSLVPNDAFGMSLKDLITQITPYPTQPREVVPTYSENPIPSCAISASVSSIPSIPTVSPTVIATNAISNKTEVKILWLSIVSLIIILTGLWFFIKKHLVKRQSAKIKPNSGDNQLPNNPQDTTTEEPTK